MNHWRRTATVFACLAISAVAGLLFLDAQHNFDVRTETFRFLSGGDELAATLHLPPGEGPHGVAVFIPGDGTADADPGALPVWESLAAAGYATVKWDKPGVRQSTGNWLDQNMDDRADEVEDVLLALSNRADINTDNVGVVGISQGGWVIPLVVERIDVKFVVAWSPAINWREQGDYLTEQQLVTADAGESLAQRVLDANNGDRPDTFDGYLVWHASLEEDVADFFSKMDEDRWNFVVRNSDLDATETLPAMNGTPVLLLLGEEDRNVDVDNTEAVYRNILDGPCLEVIRYPAADHNLLDHDGLGLTLTAIFQPRSIFATGMLEDIERFASSSHSC